MDGKLFFSNFCLLVSVENSIFLNIVWSWGDSLNTWHAVFKETYVKRFLLKSLIRLTFQIRIFFSPVFFYIFYYIFLFFECLRAHQAIESFASAQVNLVNALLYGFLGFCSFAPEPKTSYLYDSVLHRLVRL